MANVEFSHDMGAYGRDHAHDVPQQNDRDAARNSLTFATNLAGAAVSLALIAGIGVWGYKLMVRDVSGIPVVRAAEGEMRIRPEEPGGQLARHQGLAVNVIAAEGVAAGPVDQVTLAPSGTQLAAEDQPVHAEPIIQPTPLQPAADAFVAQATPRAQTNDEASTEIAALLKQGEIDAVVAELTAGVAPLVGVPGAKTVQAPQASETIPVETASAAPLPVSEPEPLVLDTSGLRSSIRPRIRPNDIAALVKPASFVPAAAAQEIDAAKIPSGTRLAQLGAFDSPDVARGEWSRLKTSFGTFLEGKSRVIEQAQSGGRTFYRLRAMGFVDLGDARRFCSAFKAEGVDCIPVLTK